MDSNTNTNINKDLLKREKQVEAEYKAKLQEYENVISQVNREFKVLEKKSEELDRTQEKFAALEKDIELFNSLVLPIDNSKELAEAEQELEEAMSKYYKLKEFNSIMKPLETYLEECINAYPLKFSINSVDELLSYVMNQLSTRSMLASHLNSITEESNAYLSKLKTETELLDLKKLEGLGQLSQNMLAEPNMIKLEDVKGEIESLTKMKEKQLDTLVNLVIGVNSVCKWAIMCRNLYEVGEKGSNTQLINQNEVIQKVKGMTIRKQLDVITKTLNYCSMLLAELIDPTGKGRHSDHIVKNNEEIRRISMGQLSSRNDPDADSE